MNMKRAFLALGATLVASAPVQAALTITEYTNRTDWENAVSAVSYTETFDSEAVGSLNNRQFTGFSTTTTADEGSIRSPGAPLTYTVRPGCSGLGGEPNINGTRYMFGAFDCFGSNQNITINLNGPTKSMGFDWVNTDQSGDDAEVTLIVDGQTFTFGPDDSSGFYGIVSDGAFASVRFDNSANGGGVLSYLGMDNFSFENAPGTALFKVTKTFVPASSATVDVTLTCDTGKPLTQTATIAGGDPEGVTFVVTDIPSITNGADCVVTESGAGAGYTTTMNPTGCTFNNSYQSLHSCAITNTAKPVTFGFTKVWDVDGMGGDILNRTSELTIYCSQPILSRSPAANGYSTYWARWNSEATSTSQNYRVTVSATGATPTCYVTEDAVDSAVEVTTSGECGTSSSPVTINIGQSKTSCTITNTVFYEGIPTLSQYGMAIMALLMLGVGFVGFRRFV